MNYTIVDDTVVKDTYYDQSFYDKERELMNKNFLVDCPQPPVQAAVNSSPCSLRNKVKKFLHEEKEKQQFKVNCEKGSNMYDLDFCEEDTMDTTKLNHLAARLSTSFHVKKAELRKAYGLEDDVPPMTAKDLIARITAGKYVIPEDRMTAISYEPTRYFIWRDPSVKKDEEGFDVAAEKLQKARTAAEDVIVVMSDEAARLKALHDFESTTIN